MTFWTTVICYIFSEGRILNSKNANIYFVQLGVEGGKNSYSRRKLILFPYFYYACFFTFFLLGKAEFPNEEKQPLNADHLTIFHTEIEKISQRQSQVMSELDTTKVKILTSQKRAIDLIKECELLINLPVWYFTINILPTLGALIFANFLLHRFWNASTFLICSEKMTREFKICEIKWNKDEIKMKMYFVIVHNIRFFA